MAYFGKKKKLSGEEPEEREGLEREAFEKEDEKADNAGKEESKKGNGGEEPEESESALERFMREIREFDSEKKEYADERARFETEKYLRENGIPAEFAEFLSDADTEVMKERAAAFKKAFSAALEAEVERKLRGHAPKSAPVNRADAFLEGFAKQY